MRKLRTALLASATAVGLLGLGWAAPARAAFIDSISDDFTITWNLAAGASDNNGGPTSTIPLTATAAFDVTSFSAGSVTLGVTFTNTTKTTGTITEAGITSFGIGVSPDATGVSFVNSGALIFSSAIIQGDPNQNYPGGFKEIDICVFTGGCSGGGQGSALAAGASDTFTLTIAGNFTNGVTLDPFPIKFQTTAGSFEFANTSTPVPEPASLALFGAGLLGLGLASRRRRQQQG